MSEYPMVEESDGIERPVFAPVATMRPEVTYRDLGRVLAGGRVHRVNYAGSHPYGGTFLGFLYVADDGTPYATPDRVTDGKYHAMRWVGGFKTRMECAAFLRAFHYGGSDWWAAEGKAYAAIAE